MSERTSNGSTLPVTEAEESESYYPITIKRIAVAMGGGFAGIVAMLPLLVGVPYLLNVFRTDPIQAFSEIGRFVTLEPSLTLGIYMFVFGGTIVLPLLFLVAGPFLPPQSPRYASGVVFGTIFWSGFLFEFWPGGSVLTIGVFLVVSLLSHWIYGLVLGLSISTLTGMPEHEV